MSITATPSTTPSEPSTAGAPRPATDKYTLIALLENQPGVLNRVASLFRRRGFNFDSLTVGRTERPDISRMTLVIDGTRAEAVRAERELRKLINVIRVDRLNGRPAVSRDLALIKVAITTESRPEVMHLCEVFRARIIDVAQDSMIVELTGDEEKIDGFIALLQPIGIVEMARAGLVAMGRGRHVLDDHGYESSWTAHRRPASGGIGAGPRASAGVLTYDPTEGESFEISP